MSDSVNMTVKGDLQHEAKRESLKNAYKSVFNSPDGKKILEDLLGVTGYKDKIFDSDTNKTFFNLGKRSVYLHILSKIEDKELT